MSLEVADAVRVALRLLEAEGLDKLTVRRLAAELGVKAPALYWHFRSKRALLDHLTDAIVAPVVAGLPSSGPWLEWLEEAGFALHTALLAHRDGARVALGADLRVADVAAPHPVVFARARPDRAHGTCINRGDCR